jgi:nucleoid DNA-binding protein
LARKNLRPIPLLYFCSVEKFYQHIEKLLSQHDYVVVPNLGGFIVQMQSAKILSDRITPPHATIGFNALMNNSDGLLAIEVSRTEQISYRQAVEYIDSKIEFINTQLNTNGSIVIGDLGILHKNASGSLTFNPIYKSNFLPQNIGLSDLYVAHREAHTRKENRKVIIHIPSNGMLKYAVAAIIVLGLFIVSPHVSDVRQTDYASLASLPCVNSFENTNNQSLEKKVVEVEKVEIKKNDTIKSPKASSQQTEIENNQNITNNYSVIVASLPSSASAQRFCDDLIKDKFTEARVLSHSKIYRVAIQSFPNIKKANEYMQHLRKSDSRFESAWVFSK